MSFVEIIFTIIIIIIAVYILIRNIKNRSTGKCDCENCKSHCSNYKKKS